MRFTDEEKLAIIKEGEKTGVKAVCAKYDICDETYRRWRYNALKIKPRKYLSSAKRLRVLREGEKKGVRAVCAKYGISDQTYRIWRYKAQGIKPRKHFSLKKKLRILEEGVRDGVCRTCAAYGINPTSYYNWRHKLGFTKLPSRPGGPERCGDEEKLAILEEGFENGILRTCTAHGISTPTYYKWKRKLGYCKSPRGPFTAEEWPANATVEVPTVSDFSKKTLSG
jgi:transposase-like protein